MRFCFYGRQSIYSERSDSIDNQFRLCKNWIDFRFSSKVEVFVKYLDEDYSGANTNRPSLQQMLEDIKSNLYDALIVYQLDRLSRDVRDFANIYALLEEHGVMFISIKENIDTTTPIGKAMMYVTVVFAQMERETIAARVTDNMCGLVKKGFWVNGNPPDGYKRKTIIVNGKKHVSIEQEPERVAYVNWIFDTFLENNYSLQSMETAFRHQGIRTKNNAYFSTGQIHAILTSPFCVEATPEIYDFFKAKGCQMASDSPREKWNGTVGVMVYGRTTEKNKKHEKQPPEKWLVCLGLHQPFMPAAKWLAVQQKLSKNKFDKTMKYDIPLLKGVLRCSCGSTMNTARKKKKQGVSSWYYCLKRMRQGESACDQKQIKTDLLDEKVLSIFRSIQKDNQLIYNFINENILITSAPDPKQADNKIKACETKISRLATALALTEDSSASKYIITKIEELDLELQALKREYNLAISSQRLQDSSNKSAAAKVKEISNLIDKLDDFSAAERNAIIKEVVKECIWDGKTLFLRL